MCGIFSKFACMRKMTAILGMFLAAVFTAGAQTGTWTGKIDVQGTLLPLVFHLDEENPTMDSPHQGVRGIPVQIERRAAGALRITVPSIGATFEGTWLVKQIVGTFTQWGTSLPLTLVPGEYRLNRPQTPKGPFPYGQEEVSFTNGDAVLRGTLVLPEGCGRQTPVLVMVTGSGLQNRDEEVYGHRPFAVIADALARAGIATLRYDDRGFGESSGDIIDCTTEDLKNDALAGIGLLRGRFGRVGVIGHSEGGTIALMLASEGHADFIVSLAGCVGSGAEALLWQNRLALAAGGIPEETAEVYCGLLSEAFRAIVDGKPLPSAVDKDLPEPLKQNYRAAIMQLQTPYMRYFLAMDMRPVLAQVACPVLAINGTKDVQVDAAYNLEALKSGLPANPENRILYEDGLNHLFQHCTTGAVTEYESIEETFAPEVLETIILWIRSLYDD